VKYRKTGINCISKHSSKNTLFQGNHVKISYGNDNAEISFRNKFVLGQKGGHMKKKGKNRGH